MADKDVVKLLKIFQIMFHVNNAINVFLICFSVIFQWYYEEPYWFLQSGCLCIKGVM